MMHLIPEELSDETLETLTRELSDMIAEELSGSDTPPHQYTLHVDDWWHSVLEYRLQNMCLYEGGDVTVPGDAEIQFNGVPVEKGDVRFGPVLSQAND